MKSILAFVVIAVAGALVGCAPQGNQEGATVEPQGLQNGSFNAEIDGFDLHYEVHGQGPVVMAVPNSWGLSLDGLRGFYKPLEDHVTVVYFDPRGMGGSGAVTEPADMGLARVRADFDALRRQLGLDTVHAIGWSNGAMNLILLAAEYPDTLASATFVHGVASFTAEDMREWAEREPEIFQLMAQLQEEIVSGDLTVDDQTALMKTFWVEKMFPASCADPEAMGPRLVEFYEDVEFSWPHAQYANQEAPVFDARDRMVEISARSLVIAGAHDSFPPEKVRELHDGLADSNFVVFPSSGHFSPLEEPEAFQSTVLEFWGVR